MVARHYLKYQHDLSDEDVVPAWVENPYWQHFSDMRHFQHQMLIDPSSMTCWRKRPVKAARAGGLAIKLIGMLAAACGCSPAVMPLPTR